MMLYTDESILDTDRDVERHRDELGRMRDAGATWVSFAFDLPSEGQTHEFIDGFARSHLGPDRI